MKKKILICYCRCVCAKLLQSCLTLCDPMDCSLPGSSVHGISQARILEWVAMPSSRGSSRPRDPSRISYVSCIGSRFFTISAAREAPVFSQSGASNPRLKTMLLPIACITCCTPLLALLPKLHCLSMVALDSCRSMNPTWARLIPKPYPLSQSVEKLSSAKPVSGTKKLGDCFSRLLTLQRQRLCHNHVSSIRHIIASEMFEMKTYYRW